MTWRRWERKNKLRGERKEGGGDGRVGGGEGVGKVE